MLFLQRNLRSSHVALLLALVHLVSGTVQAATKEPLWPCWAGHSQGCQVFPRCQPGYRSINGRWGVQTDGSGCIQFAICPPNWPVNDRGFGFFQGESCFYHHGPALVPLNNNKKSKVTSTSSTNNNKSPAKKPSNLTISSGDEKSSSAKKTSKPTTSSSAKKSNKPSLNAKDTDKENNEVRGMRGFVQSHGGRFYLNGKPFYMLGANTYDLAAEHGPCRPGFLGDSPDEFLETYFRLVSQKGMNTIRIMAFQAYDDHLHDFSSLARVIKYAHKYNVRLVVTMENHWGDCKGNVKKNLRWYAQGYREVDPKNQMSFRKYARLLVTRFRKEPAIAMWQIINEASNYEEPRPDAPHGVVDNKVVQAFFQDMSALIKSVDRNHLLSGGAIFNCWQGDEGVNALRMFSEMDTVDVLDVHDYTDEGWEECRSKAVKVSQLIRKPLIFGEFNTATAKEGGARARILAEKMIEARKRGVQGLLVWEFRPKGKVGSIGHYVIHEDDPIMELFVKMSGRKNQQ